MTRWMRRIICGAALSVVAATLTLAPIPLFAVAALFFVGGLESAATAQQVWRVGEPTLRIGDQTPEHEVHLVTSLLVRGGRLYVADRDQQIRAFDVTTGDLIVTGGGSGQGPGEFRFLEWIDDCADDELFAADAVLDRISVFSFDLEHIRTFQIGNPGTIMSMRCAGPDRLVAMSRHEDTDFTEIRPGPYRKSVQLSLFASEDGRFLSAFGRYPGEDRYRESSNDGPWQWGRKPLIESLHEGFIFGTSEGWWLTRHDAAGAVLDSLVIDEQRRPISGSDIEADIQEHLELQERRYRRSQAFLAARREFLEAYEYPEYYPAYSAILASDAGFVWAQEYPYVGQRASHWKVFSPEGKHVGIVDMPPGFQMMWVGDTHVAGIKRNDLGVEFVEIRPVQRRTPNQPG